MKKLLLFLLVICSLISAAQNAAPTKVSMIESKVDTTLTPSYIPFTGSYLGGLRYNQLSLKWQYSEDGGTTWKAFGAGTIGGSGTSSRVAYWSGTHTLSSTSGFSFNSGTGLLTVPSLALGLSGPLIGNGSGAVTAAVSGTDFKTINSASILGSGNITISAPTYTFNSPLSETGGTVSIQTANTSQSGVVSSTDWNTFNNKGSGSVTSVSVTTANGVSGTVATDTTTPAITISLGNITPITVNGVTISGSSTPTLAVTGITTVSGANTGDQTTVTGNAGTATALQTARTIGTVTGDATSAGSSFDGTANNTNALTLATVNSNVGSFGSATQSLSTTVNAKGLVTAISAQTITPALASITSGTSAALRGILSDEFGTGAALFDGATPTSFILTNATALPVTGLAAGSASALDQIRRNSGNTAWETYTPLANPWTTTGDLVQGVDNIGGFARLAAGTSGLPLKSNGAGTLVSYGQIGDAAISDLAYSKLTGTVPFYTKSAGGVATAANTLDFSGASWLNFTGTFTTTANNQAMTNFGGTHTMRGTTSDYFASYNFNNSIIFGANSQTGAAINLELFPNAGSFTGTTATGLMIRYNSSLAATQTTNAIQIQDQNAGPVNKLRITTSGSLVFGTSSLNRIRAAGTNNGNLVIESDFGNSTTVDVPSIIFEAGGSFGGSTGHRVLLGTPATANTFAGTGSSSYDYFYGGQIISGSASGAISGFVWDPTYSSYTGTGAHYGFRAFEAASLSGFGTSAPTSTLTSGGSLGLSYVAKTANYTAASDYFIDCTSNSFTVTLPSAVSITGRTYFINNSGTGTTITLATTSSQTIDGNAPGVLYSKESIELQSDGANWKILNLKTNKEVISTVSTFTNFTTTATYQNLASITLDPGDWDISAFFTYSSNGATITAANDALFVISTTTASEAGFTEGKNKAYIPQAALLGTSHESGSINPYLVSPTTSTLYYLNGQATFTIGNPQYSCTIRARKVR